MDGIWTTLGLEPARDVSAIKRAHAGRTKTCRPEGFAAAERLFIISVRMISSGIESSSKYINENITFLISQSEERNCPGKPLFFYHDITFCPLAQAGFLCPQLPPY